MTLDEILNNKNIEDNGYITPCWIWKGALLGKGYGTVRYNDEYWLVHRLIYKIFNFDFKKHLDTLHKCDITKCFNPEHLFQGSNLDNIHDMCNKGRHWRQKTTHCPKGHKYTEDNIYINPKSKTRSCKICRTARNRRIA